MKSIHLPLPRWFSFLSLIIATALLRFSLNGLLFVPTFSWLFAIFMMIWVRSNKPGWGFALGWIFTSLAVALMTLPVAYIWGDGWIFWMVVVVVGSQLFLPFVVDRIVSWRLSGIIATLVFPLTWVSVEFLSSFNPYTGTAFMLALTQFISPLITQISSITGLWAITFLMVWLAPVICLVLESRFEWQQVALPVSLYLIVLVAVLCFGGIRLGLDRRTSSTVRVAGITASSRDGSLESGVFLLNTYVPQAAAAGAKIVMTHEGAVLIDTEDESAVIEAGKELAQQEDVYILIGFQVEDKDRSLPFENKTVFVSPDGEVEAEYTKQRLMPGELGYYVRGEGAVPVLETPYGKIASLICSDVVFPDYVRRQVGRRGVDILLVPAWDFREAAYVWPYGTAFRAIENGLAMFRLARESLSIAVDQKGRPLVQSNYFFNDQSIIYADLPTEGRQTLYSLLGDWFAWMSIGGLAMLLVIVAAKRRSETKRPIEPILSSQH